jgi:hypothetical protein
VKNPSNARITPSAKPPSQDVAERLKQLGCDPLAGMVKLAMDPANPAGFRADTAAELALYVRPRRKTGWPKADSPFSAAEAKLKALGFDPVECLARIAVDDANPNSVRVKALRYLARDYRLAGGQRVTDEELRKLLGSSDRSSTPSQSDQRSTAP